MLKLGDWKLVFAAAGLIGVLLFASPTLGMVLHLPLGEKFSELWLLGPGRMAEDYPTDINASASSSVYSVYVGVGNHMLSSAYYVLYVKFGNQTDALPNLVEASPSSLQPLYQYRTFLRDNENWTVPLNFSFPEVSFSSAPAGNSSVVETLTINNIAFGVNSLSLRNELSRTYYYKLFVELWIFDSDSNVVQYDNRFLSLSLSLVRR